MTTVPIAALAFTFIVSVTPFILLVLAGARHGHEQYQRGYEAGRYEAGQAAERARGEW